MLAEFKTLREAVRAAGLEPNPKGEKISTAELILDWKRVGKKLGRRPSRSEYVREGKYSAGAFVARFGSWGRISTAEGAKEHKGKIARIAKESKLKTANHKGHELIRREFASKAGSGSFHGDKALAFQWGQSLAAIPAPLAGKRRVTEAVAQLVVNTLLGDSSQHSALSIQPQNTYHGDPETWRAAKEVRGINKEGHRDASLAVNAPLVQDDDLRRCNFTQRGIHKEGDLGPSLAVNAPLVQDDRRRRADFAARGIRKDRPVMGAPFDRSPLTNAPVNELGVVLLFGMVAADMGFQVESLQGKFPDCEAKREVAPGKWQRCRIEFEHESKNFLLHGHDPKGCDVIVCWRHNWRECPAEIEVIELSRLFGM